MLEQGPVHELIPPAPTELGIAERTEHECVMCGRATFDPYGLCARCQGADARAR